MSNQKVVLITGASSGVGSPRLGCSRSVASVSSEPAGTRWRRMASPVSALDRT
jgi:hypothetical protein